MKKKWMTVMTAILAMSSTVPALAQHIYAGDDVEKVVSYDENGWKIITLIFDPAKMPDEVREQLGLASPEENKENTTKLENVSTAVKLTEPPKEGEVLANIQYVDGMVIKEDYQTFLENSQLKLAGYLKVKG